MAHNVQVNADNIVIADVPYKTGDTAVLSDEEFEAIPDHLFTDGVLTDLGAVAGGGGFIDRAVTVEIDYDGNSSTLPACQDREIASGQDFGYADVADIEINAADYDTTGNNEVLAYDDMVFDGTTGAVTNMPATTPSWFAAFNENVGPNNIRSAFKETGLYVVYAIVVFGGATISAASATGRRAFTLSTPFNGGTPPHFTKVVCEKPDNLSPTTLSVTATVAIFAADLTNQNPVPLYHRIFQSSTDVVSMHVAGGVYIEKVA